MGSEWASTHEVDLNPCGAEEVISSSLSGISTFLHPLGHQRSSGSADSAPGDSYLYHWCILIYINRGKYTRMIEHYIREVICRSLDLRFFHVGPSSIALWSFFEDVPPWYVNSSFSSDELPDVSSSFPWLWSVHHSCSGSLQTLMHICSSLPSTDVEGQYSY